MKYSSMKLDFLALKWAITEKFSEYLLGNKCVVYTDNNPLSHLSSCVSKEGPELLLAPGTILL